MAKLSQSLSVPGIAFAEWGPGDMGYSLGFPENHDAPYPPEMLAARGKVLAACKAHHLFFLNTMLPNDVIDVIKEGVMIGGSAEAAEIGRKYVKRGFMIRAIASLAGYGASLLEAYGKHSAEGCPLRRYRREPPRAAVEMLVRSRLYVSL